MADDHVQGSLQAAEGVFARLSLTQADRATVRFLIKNHLEMSAMLQRRTSSIRKRPGRWQILPELQSV